MIYKQIGFDFIFLWSMKTGRRWQMLEATTNLPERITGIGASESDNHLIQNEAPMDQMDSKTRGKKMTIKKTAVLNQVIFWILERFLLLKSFKYI